jgi:predicted DNA binding protein
VADTKTENEVTLSAVYDRYRAEIAKYKVGELRPLTAQRVADGDSEDEKTDPATFKSAHALTDEQRQAIVRKAQGRATPQSTP